MIKFSVIVPNYNHASFLKERIDSVLNQTFQDFEVIILDDKSTDDSKQVIESYRKHPKVSNIIYNKINSGSTFKQWRKGLKYAKGEWIWIAESDDVANAYFLEEVEKRMNHQKLGLIYCNSLKINNKSIVINNVNESWFNDLGTRDWTSECFINDGVEEIKEYLFYKNILPNASAVVFKKGLINDEVFEEISTMKYAGDWLFWYRIFNKNRIAYISKPLNMFRHHDNTTRSKKTLIEEINRLYEYLYVIKIIKKEHGLKWNISKHSWILRDFQNNIKTFRSFKEFKLFLCLPNIYKHTLFFNQYRK